MLPALLSKWLRGLIIKAFVFSVGEPTTELSAWSLERLGFEVTVMQDSNPLWDKLQRMFTQVDEDVLRVDADVICNKKVLDLVGLKTNSWYLQCYAFDWFKQDLTHTTPSYIKKEALPAIRTHLDEIAHLDRPETYLTRLPEFHNPRRHETANLICGLHGFLQSNANRVKRQKERRNQAELYDFELAERINGLIYK